MRVGFYQNSPVFGEVQKNVEEAVKALAKIDADLVVLPELFSSGYQFVSQEEVATVSEEIPNGPTCQEMEEIARQKDMHIVFGLPERSGDKFFNSAVIVGPSGFVGLYRKTHLFFDEKDFFHPGDTGFKVFDIGIAKVGIMICFDWFFPESARILSLKGAQIICHPANLVLPYCQRSMPTRCLENMVFAITANRIGTEQRGTKDQLTFTGQSQIVNTKGEVLANTGREEIGVVLTDIDPALALDKKITEKNDLFADRRPDYYGQLLSPI